MTKENRRIIITGGAGFIGSNFLNLMVPQYPTDTFINIDCLTYAGNLNNIEVKEAPNYRFYQIDIRNKEELEKVFEQEKPTDIIHFAAESHVDQSIKNPNIFLETNVLGTGNLLALAKKYELNRFHQVSTDEVYGALGPNDPPFTEDTPLAPRNPYSASKASADLLVKAYHETFGLDTIITRCGNNFGPRQDLTKVIPLFLSKLLKGEKVPLYGEGANVREWIYVDDHTRGIDAAFRRGQSGNIYNIGAGNELSNLDLTKKLLAATNRDESYIERVTDRLGHDFRYALSTAKANSDLNWQPQVSFEEGLKLTLEYYKLQKLNGI